MYIVVRTEGKHNMGYGGVCVLHVHVCSVYAKVINEIEMSFSYKFGAGQFMV